MDHPRERRERKESMCEGERGERITLALKVSKSRGMEAANVVVSFFLSCLFPGFSILSLTPSQSTTMVSSRPVRSSLSSRDRAEDESVLVCEFGVGGVCVSVQACVHG